MRYNNMWDRGYHEGFMQHSFHFNIFFIILIVLLVVWIVAMKGYALWHAAKRNEKWWFIVLLVVNTMGILELFYLIFIAKALFQGKHHTHHHPHEVESSK